MKKNFELLNKNSIKDSADNILFNFLILNKSEIFFSSELLKCVSSVI